MNILLKKKTTTITTLPSSLNTIRPRVAWPQIRETEPQAPRVVDDDDNPCRRKKKSMLVEVFSVSVSSASATASPVFVPLALQ